MNANSLKIAGYNLDFSNVVETIKDKDFKKIVLQLPEGLKFYALDVVDFLKKETDAFFIVSSDPCFGACDLVSSNYEDLSVDLAVQIGHTSIPSVKEGVVPTVFVNAESDLDVSDLIGRVVCFLEGKRVGLVTTAQHIHKIDEIKDVLNNHGVEVFVSGGDDRVVFDGQILGCNFSAAVSVKDDVDLFLFVGSGDFHPLGLMLSTGRSVVTLDPYSKKIRDVVELDDLKDSVLRQRYGAIARSKDARVFAVLLGVKVGQQRVDLVDSICKKLEDAGKRFYVFAADFFSPAVLDGFRGIDCFVSTSCPRIAIDDYMRYKTPILTPVELDVLLGIKKWDEYGMDEI